MPVQPGCCSSGLIDVQGLQERVAQLEAKLADEGTKTWMLQRLLDAVQVCAGLRCAFAGATGADVRSLQSSQGSEQAQPAQPGTASAGAEELRLPALADVTSWPASFADLYTKHMLNLHTLLHDPAATPAMLFSSYQASTVL